MHFSNPIIFITVLIDCGLLAAAVVVALVTRVLLSPPRMTDGKAVYLLRRLSPGDLGLHFSDESFTTRDGRTGRPLHTAAWWVPAATEAGKTVVVLHGYADAKVGGIAWAPLFHDLGYHVLAIDLRAHGESGGRHTTGGFHEQDDLDQVLNQLRARRPDQTQQLCLFGASLGAATAALVAANRSDLSAVILDSPFADYPAAVAAHARRSGLPGGMLLSMSLKLAEWVTASDFAAARPVDAVARANCPLLLILSENDELLDANHLQALTTAVRANPGGLLWLVQNAAHLTAMSTQPRAYAARVGAFLSRAVPDAGAADQG